MVLFAEGMVLFVKVRKWRVIFTLVILCIAMAGLAGCDGDEETLEVFRLQTERQARLSAGANHSHAILDDGSLWAWGRNQAGQLGDGTDISRLTPIQIKDDVIAVSASGSIFGHTLAVTADGALYAWGHNQWGQLGDGTTESSLTPIHIMDDVVSASAGWNHSLAVTADGALWAWGEDISLTPERIIIDVVAMSAGGGHAMAITSDGSLWAMSDNRFGQLGDGTTTRRHSPVYVMDSVVAVSAGDSHTLAITADGALWAWGSNSHGQLGDGTTTHRHIPIHIMDGVISAYAGGRHSLAITADGDLWAWGNNESGQLVNVAETEIHSPATVKEGAIAVAAGWEHTLVLTADGSIWAYGGNEHGQLGNGTTESSVLVRQRDEVVMRDEVRIRYETEIQEETRRRYEEVEDVPSVVSVSTSGSHTLVITDNGALWTWGSNSHGQLGDGTVTVGEWVGSNWNIIENNNRDVPVHIMDDVVDIHAKSGNSFAITSDGALWAWGDNRFGQLGDGTTESRHSPVHIKNNVISVYADLENSYAITSDGVLWGWGWNTEWNPLGDGTTTSRHSPVRIMDDVVTMHIEHTRSFAITSDGALWAWGSGGILGDGTTENRIRPVHIMDGVVTVSVGSFHTMAIASDGALWAWGMNYGALGDGTTENRHTPVHIMDDVVAVSAGLGQSHTHAITSDGTLWGWGWGLLGIDTYSASLVPVQVMDNVVSVATGFDNAEAITSDGILWEWGSYWVDDGDFGFGCYNRIPVHIMDDVVSLADIRPLRMVLTSDGSLWTWHWNINGGIGYVTPVPVIRPGSMALVEYTVPVEVQVPVEYTVPVEVTIQVPYIALRDSIAPVEFLEPFFSPALVGTWHMVESTDMTQADVMAWDFSWVFNADGTSVQLQQDRLFDVFKWLTTNDGRLILTDFWGTQSTLDYNIHDNRLTLTAQDLTMVFAAQVLDDSLIGIWRVTEMTGRTQAELVMTPEDFMFFSDGSGIERVGTHYNDFAWHTRNGLLVIDDIIWEYQIQNGVLTKTDSDVNIVLRKTE